MPISLARRLTDYDIIRPQSPTSASTSSSRPIHPIPASIHAWCCSAGQRFPPWCIGQSSGCPASRSGPCCGPVQRRTPDGGAVWISRLMAGLRVLEQPQVRIHERRFELKNVLALLRQTHDLDHRTAAVRPQPAANRAPLGIICARTAHFQSPHAGNQIYRWPRPPCPGQSARRPC